MKNMAALILDIKDAKILQMLEENARQSNNQIGKKVGLSKEVVKYRIDRLIAQGLIVRFYTITNYFKVGIVKFKLYLRLKNITKEKMEEIGTYLQFHQKTEWVAFTTGRWDIIIGFLVKNVNEFDQEVLSFLDKYAEVVQEKAITTTLHLVHQKREFTKLLSENVEKIIYHSTLDKQEKITSLEEDIIKVLTNNARLPASVIARKVNSTTRIVQYHIKELERKQIILGYKVHIDPKVMQKIFGKLIIYLHNVDNEKIKKFTNYCSAISGVVWPQRVVGDWDFELDMEINDYNQFQDIIFEIKEKFSDIIKNHEFCIVSKEFKLDLFPGCAPEIKP